MMFDNMPPRGLMQIAATVYIATDWILSLIFIEFNVNIIFKIDFQVKSNLWWKYQYLTIWKNQPIEHNLEIGGIYVFQI